MSAISQCRFCGEECVDPWWMPRGSHERSTPRHALDVHGLDHRAYWRARRLLDNAGVYIAESAADREIADRCVREARVGAP